MIPNHVEIGGRMESLRNKGESASITGVVRESMVATHSSGKCNSSNSAAIILLLITYGRRINVKTINRSISYLEHLY